MPPKATYLFPSGFLWGTATAAHQVEGDNTNNNWYAWEQDPAHIFQGQRSGRACDWWGGRWKEDLDRAAETGQNAHRLSIEWSRVQPAPDRWDEDALDHYRQIVRGLVERGMTPMVTLHHFTEPLWLSEISADILPSADGGLSGNTAGLGGNTAGYSGWETDAVAPLFGTFARRVTEALKDYVSLWVTINEPNTFVWGGYLGGGFPPGKNDLKLAFQVMENMVRGHVAAYRAIHTVQPTARVGIGTYYRSFKPARSWLPLDKLAIRLIARIFNDQFPQALTDGTFNTLLGRKRIPEAAHTMDFLGVQYYTRDMVAFTPLAPKMLFSRRYYRKDAELSDTGFLANEPEGMFEALRWGKRYGVPMMVTENGIENAADTLRPRYIVQHIHQIWRAVNFSWPVKGYFHWTLVDNFEWERGWSQRFGLWELDPETQARKKRRSADLFGEICRTNGISSDTVQKYTPELFEKLFPG
jgi:beta-glucosidase